MVDSTCAAAIVAVGLLNWQLSTKASKEMLGKLLAKPGALCLGGLSFLRLGRW